MLGDKDAAANIAVKNLETAKSFYENTLGLTHTEAEDQEAIVFERELDSQCLSVTVRWNQQGHCCDMGSWRGY
jgi:catechol-2,3-dioxygenase